MKQLRQKLSGPLVEVNCATVRGDGAMSALFSHVRGSFTAALKDRPGLLRKADQGGLFLDEIAELGLDEQAMLLRAIEEKLFAPVGADHEVKSDFRGSSGRISWRGSTSGRSACPPSPSASRTSSRTSTTRWIRRGGWLASASPSAARPGRNSSPR